ncbi:MAG: multiheme c-type cytochrome [Candidatus Poribacteria bacterium]|nr:multiheme c-type cytochrome [Candidatus Poribacteria bacterium]
MKKVFFILPIFAVIGYFSLLALSSTSMRPATTEPPPDFTLVISGQELGYLEPCGCAEGQLGGIARRDSFLQQLRAHGNTIVPIANGNLIQDALPQSEIKADIGFFALADMGYVAYNIGERDLELGTAQLTALSERNRLPLISANLYQGTSPAFIPYLLHTVQLPDDAVEIAIVGLISPSYAVYAKNTDLRILEPTTILDTLIPELTENADIIVCLFNGTSIEASKLRNNLPRLSIIVVSNDNTEGLPLSASDHQFVNTGTKGKSIYSVKVHSDITGHPVVKDSQQHLLDEQIPDSQRMIDLLALYQQMITDENSAASVPRTQQKTGPQFVGTATCKTCHITEWTSWKATKHAHAYHTLEVAGHETDPDCLTCHTVGFGFSTGFLSVEETPNHLDVGCENCHGAGSTHVKQQQNEVSKVTDIGYGKVTETTCLVCHTVENSPKFDLNVYFPKIVHTLEKHR